MNFLQLCQRLRQECGGNGTGPASVTSQTGENRQYVDWVNQAYLEIQSDRPDWHWLWATDSLAVSAGVAKYSPASQTINRDRVLLDGNRLGFVLYQNWPTASLTAGRPTHFTLQPDGQLQLNRQPEQDGTLEYEFYRTPVELSGNEDVPRLPEHYHMLIIYKAMQYYAGYENAPEIMQVAHRNYEQLLAQLGRDALPQLEFAGPLA